MQMVLLLKSNVLTAFSLVDGLSKLQQKLQDKYLQTILALHN